MNPLSKHLDNQLKLIVAGLAACLGINIFVGEQFLSIILPGRAFKVAYNQGGLSNDALGRVLEEGGTVINYLVPWGVGGVFLTNTLGVTTINYLPFVFFSLLCPVFSIISGITGWGLLTVDKKRDLEKAIKTQA
jgi:NhaC family Na+:H+ antiporter